MQWTCEAYISKNLYQLRETLFDKLDSFGIQYTDDQKIFTNLAVFDFESIRIPEEKFKNTETRISIGKHYPISVSISSNPIAKPIFLCNSNARDLVESFFDAVEGLATQSKAQMKLKFLEKETAIKSKLIRTLESLNERRCRNQRVFEFEVHCFEDDNEERDASTQFLQMQKNQVIELQEHLERYCNVLPVFGFNSAKYDINLIKSYLLPILINERNMEPIVIWKANEFVSFKFGDVQLLDIINFLGGATSLDSFLKAYKISETRGFFPYEWFDCPQNVNNSEILHYDAFFSKLRNVSPLEKDYSDYQTLFNSGLKIEEALSKMKLSQPPPSGEENYQYLLDNWNHENMCTFKDFYAGTTTKRLSRHSRLCKNCLLFITRKELTCLSSGVHLRIWRIFVSINLPAPNSIHLLKPIKTCCKGFEKIWLVDLLSSSHVKLWSTKLLSRNQEILVNLLLALTQISCIPILCASPCQQDYTHDGNMTQNLIDLNLNRANLETLRTWLCHISRAKNPTVKLRVSTLQELRKRLIVSR